MEQYGFRVNESEFVIDGLPQDAAKIISFDGLLPGHSRNLWSLAAHGTDLNSAKTYLKLINSTETDVRRALWKAAIVFYCKCYSQTNKKGARRPLHPGKTLSAEQSRDIHAWFMSLRNLNIAHDENAWLQALPGAVIAAPEKGYNIERVICTTVEGESLNQANLGKLNLLVEESLRWVTSEFEKLCVDISTELEKVPRETLLSQPGVTYRAPEAHEVHSPKTSA